jgi:chromate transporter
MRRGKSDGLSLLLLFRVWLGIGIQSFGGGTTTMTLIRRNAVDIHGWISDEQFNRDWALCQMTPGINLIALTVLVGRQAAGLRGAAICLAGLLLPSAFLTALITAGFVQIRDLPSVQGALRGVLPATVGLGLMTACQMAHLPLQSSQKRGVWQLVFALALLFGSGAALWSGKASVVEVLLIAGAVGAIENLLAARLWPERETDPE